MILNKMFHIMKRSVHLIYIGMQVEKTVSQMNVKYSGLILNSCIHTSGLRFANDERKTEQKYLIRAFEFAKKKEKETFLECIRQYESKGGPRSDHLKFIKVAMKYMDEFGVNKDLDVYKSLLHLFPKGKMVPKNSLQVVFFHYPQDQFCAVELLEKMEDNGVIPDPEVETILLNAFGKFGHPLMKLYALNYWFPKFKNLSPWPVPKPLPNDTLEVAKEVIKRITSVDLQTEISVFNSEDIKDSIDKTWIVSAISPKQGELLIKHNKKKPIFVEGPFRTWLGNISIEYFILRAKVPAEGYQLPKDDPDDVSNIRIPHLELDYNSIILWPSVHEQKDGIIFSVCATETSSKDSLLSWIRCLQKEHPVLEEIPIVFTLKKSSDDTVYVTDGNEPMSQIANEDQKKIDDR